MTPEREVAELLPKSNDTVTETFDALTRLALDQFGVQTVLLVQHAHGQDLTLSSAGYPCTVALNGLAADCFRIECPAKAADGTRRGALILLDPRPRTLTVVENRLLEGMAVLARIAIEEQLERIELQHQAQRLLESEQRMALAIANSGTGVWDRDIISNEIHYSPGWKAILGYDEDELTSQITDSYQRVHPDDLSYVQDTIQAHFWQQTPHYDVEHRIRCKDGDYKWICSRGRVVAREPDGKPLRMIGTTTDITERKRLEAELKSLAAIDFLTQLPNRRHFMQQLGVELAHIHRDSTHTAVVLMCDLDHFKDINDLWGHTVGDDALKHFAGILAGQLRKTDIGGRIGGEEFAVLLRKADLQMARCFGVRLQAALSKQPLQHAGTIIEMTVSIGISAVVVTDATPDAALTRSDQALYRAKQAGRDRIEG